MKCFKVFKSGPGLLVAGNEIQLLFEYINYEYEF